MKAIGKIDESSDRDSIIVKVYELHSPKPIDECIY